MCDISECWRCVLKEGIYMDGREHIRGFGPVSPLYIYYHLVALYQNTSIYGPGV